MGIFKVLLLGLLMATPYLLTGCGEDDATTTETNTTSTETNTTTTETNTTVDDVIDLNTSTVTVILPVSSSSLTIGNEVVNIDVNVIDNANNPVITGEVKIVFPNDVREGRDVGSFENLSSELNNGVASFVYTAPSQLDQNTSDIVFGFYHSENLSDIKNYTFSINPSPDQVVLKTYYLINSVSDDAYTMGLEDEKQITFYVKDNDGVLVSDAKVTSMNIALLNPNLADLQDLDGVIDDNITITSSNSCSVNILSNTISGTVPISVDVVFVDVNGNSQTISEVFNVVILSGPASAISLSYASTSQNAEYAKFIENWVLTVTDKYNNRVNTSPAVSMGMIAGYAIDATSPGSNPYEFIYYEPSSGGTLLETSPEDIFDAPADIFTNVDQENEVLVLFGDGYTYDASGKWDFYTHADDDKLKLIDDFNGTDTSNLGFAVGNNYRQDANDEGVEWIGNVYPQDESSILDANGNMIIQIEYDYYLTGKDVVLWVNLTGEVHALDTIVKIGEAKKITLRGQGIEAASTVSVPKNTTATYRIYLKVSNTVEDYRNARFTYGSVKVSDTVRINNITDSNGDIKNNRVAYIEVTVTTDVDEGGTIELVSPLIVSEF